MFIGFFLLWILLNGNFALKTILLGIAFSTILYLFLCVFFGFNIKKDIKICKNIPIFIAFVFMLIISIIVANAKVMKVIIDPKDKPSLCSYYLADTIISLALSSRIDLGVNYENWCLNDVNQFFHKYGFQSYYAADLYAYVIENPATYLRYFIGFLEIEQLKQDFMTQKGTIASEKAFHKQLLDIGPGDFNTIRNYLLPDEEK